MTTTPTTTTPPRLYRLTEFAARHGFPVRTLRHYRLFQSDRISSRGDVIPGNGADRFGVFVLVGGCLFVDEDAFWQWVRWQNSDQRRAG